jgi:hypothetical protein
MAATANTGNRLRFYNGHEPPVFGPATQEQADDALADVLSSRNNAPITSFTGAGAFSVATQPANTSVIMVEGLPDAAASYTILNVPYDLRVLDAWLIRLAGGHAGNTLVVKNGAVAICTAASSVVDINTVCHSTLLVTSAQDMSAGDSLVITIAKGGASALCSVGILVARTSAH